VEIVVNGFPDSVASGIREFNTPSLLSGADFARGGSEASGKEAASISSRHSK
jgi:hypothetical protein